MKKDKKEFKSFGDFINLYEVQKTLRFELKPVGKTEELLKINKVFEKDKTIDDSYNQAKFYFDEMHREFINTSLTGISPNVIQPLIKAFIEKGKQEERGDKRASGKEWDKARKIFCVKIANIFNMKAKEIEREHGIPKDERKGIKYLLSAKILDHLKQKFPKEKNNEFVNKKWPKLFVKNQATGEEQYIFDSFDKCTTYLGKFQKTRNNLYAANDKATSVASRIIDNFVIFQGNKNKFENKLRIILDKENFTSTEQDVFKQNYYIKCFVQDGIDKYNEVVGNINKKIKEFRDREEKKAKENRREFKKGNYPLLIKLDKQILSYKDKEKELIENDEDLKKVFEDFVKNNNRKFKKGKDLLNNFCDGKFAEEYGKIYLQKKVLNTISRKWFIDANAFELLLPQTSGKQKDENIASIKKYISLSDIKSALEKEEKDGGLSGNVFKDKYYDDEWSKFKSSKLPEKRFEHFLVIWKFEFANLFQNKKLSDGSLIKGYDSCLKETEKINWGNLSQKNKKEELYKKEIEKVKQYADVSLDIYQMLKYFVLGGKDAPIGSDLFYGEFNDYYQDLEFSRYYNALRNYITKKSFSLDKIKLNFENGQLLNGWDKNQEKAKFGIILKKDGLYYLGILMDKYKDIFENIGEDMSGDFYEKMEYKFFPDPKREIPKIAFAKKNKEKFGLTEEIEEIKKEYENFQKEKEDQDNWKNEFDKNKCAKLINYYQKCLEIGGYKKEYDFSWKKPEEYPGIGAFNDDIARQNYKITFKKINSNYVDDKVSNGKMYLFQIYNKDLSEQSIGKGKNIHTLYFTNLFSDNNLKNPILKLSGGAEIFFRKKADNLSLKKDKKGKKVFDHKRYSEDKILIYVPIKLNRGESRSFNKQINLFLSKNEDVNIIGIDRGEKNLLYYSVINQNGEIFDQGSLNIINGVNYFEKLSQREKEKIEAKQSWNQIEQIKDLKKGYLSWAIHKICTLIEQYNAIVVLEDLNMRFKQIRGGIEKSVYQQFEKALIDKLGYLVFKDRRPEEPGGVLRGYQLVAPFESFEKMEKQTGILFYTQADYTSITDPVTGFRKNIYIGNSWSQEKIKSAINKFKSIKWNDEIGCYAFTYNPADFVYKLKFKNKKIKNNLQEMISREWTVCSGVSRIERFRNNAGYWEYNVVDLNEKFKELFNLWGFDVTGDILKQIQEKEANKQLAGDKLIDGTGRDFYHRFVYLFNLILQLRNSFSKKIIKDEKGNIKEIGDDIDFIASPVHPFFSMGAKSKVRGVISKTNLAGFEEKIRSNNRNEIVKNLNGDANGAYNIARKGIMILERIAEKPEKPDLYIAKNEWDKFTQNQWNLISKSQK
jgi:hypothetical protein